VNFQDFSLDSRIMSGIKTVGYTEPTPIQEQAIPVIMQGKDVLGLAQTGTGKTAAFALPILQKLTTGPLRRTRVLIVAPTRELAEQIHQSFVDLSGQLKIRSTAIYGGVGKGAQISQLQRGCEIVVACPGRLLDLYNEGHVDLTAVEILVLDEADRMCDMGFMPDIRRIIKRLPPKRQNLFFSATMPADIRELVNDILQNPVTVQVGIIAPAETVEHAIYPIPQNAKKGLLLAMLENERTGQVLIFTRTKYRARNLARDLAKENYRVAALQGNMSQNQRQAAITGFRSGKFDILVATDIAARGIDISNVTHVINFDMPDTVDAYTHRIGRTGRAERSGDAFTLADPDDLLMIRQIERLLKQPLERKRHPAFDYGDFIPETALQATPNGRTHTPQPRPQPNGRSRPTPNNNNRSRNRSRSY
jgi:ATP-dependent RNA helicase RhlE